MRIIFLYLLRENSNCVGIIPQTSSLQESNDCEVSSENLPKKANSSEEKHENVNRTAIKSERPSRKRKAECDPLAARKRTENESRVSKCLSD